MMENPKPIDYISGAFRFAIKFEYVIFPLDVGKLLQALAESGYATAGQAPNLVGQPIRLTAKGIIAQKGDSQVELNDERGVIAVTGSTPEQVIQIFEEVVNVITKKLEVDIDSKAAFYEFTVGLEVKTKKEAMNTLEKVTYNPYYERIGKIMGMDLTGVSLKIVPKDGIPSSSSWMELIIEPIVIKPSNYRATVVFRRKTKVEVETFARHYLDNLATILETIETE